MTNLFQPTGPEGNFRHNAMLHPNPDDTTLGMGFTDAGDALVQHWVEPGPNDALLLPIIYDYRHGIELVIKQAIRDAAACLRRDGGHVVPTKKNLDDWLSRSAGHKLQALANRLDDYLTMLDQETLPPDIHEVLKTSHEMDPGGDTFRYTTTWDKEEKRYVPAARPDATHIDVVAMGKGFREVAQLIGWGTSTMLDQYKEWQQDMAEETRSYKSYY